MGLYIRGGWYSQWVSYDYLEEVVVEVQGAYARVQSKGTLGGAARRREDPERDAALGHPRDEVELAHGPGQQVGAHLGTHVEGHFLVRHARGTAAGALLRWDVGGGQLGHVGQSGEVRRQHDRHREGGLHGRFVHAGEGTPSIQRFELRAGHDLLLAIRVRVRGAVEPSL